MSLELMMKFVINRKAKHHFGNALEQGRAVSSLGVDASLARRGIIALLHSSDKDQDTELIQVTA
jgi:hypothetical protein